MQVGQSAAIQDMYIVPPPQNLTVLSTSISPNWSFDNDEYVLSAITPSATNDCTGTMVYQSCLDSFESAVWYVNVTCALGGGLGVPDLIDPTTGNELERWSGSFVISYPDASCANLYSVGGAFVATGGLAYQPNASFWEAPSSFLCVPSSDYQWVSRHSSESRSSSTRPNHLLLTLFFPGLFISVALDAHLDQQHLASHHRRSLAVRRTPQPPAPEAWNIRYLASVTRSRRCCAVCCWLRYWSIYGKGAGCGHHKAG